MCTLHGEKLVSGEVSLTNQFYSIKIRQPEQDSKWTPFLP